MKWFNYCNKGEFKRSVFAKLILSIIVIGVCFFLGGHWPSNIGSISGYCTLIDVILVIYFIIYVVLGLYYLGLIWGNSPFSSENILLLPLWRSMGMLKKYNGIKPDKSALSKSVTPILVSLILCPMLTEGYSEVIEYNNDINDIDYFNGPLGLMYQLLGLFIYILPLLIIIYEVFKLQFRHWENSDQ